MRRVLFTAPVVALLVLAVFGLMPCMATCGGADDTVTAAVHACPRALQLLGDDAKPARIGVACGSTKTEGAYGRASWTLAYTGSRARGSVSFAAEKRADTWNLDAATLEVDDEVIDLVACAAVGRGGKPPPKAAGGTLAQTNADAASAKFDGKVLRSTHATVKAGAVCRGELTRERGSPFAHVKIECDPGTAESGGATVFYDGTGGFTMDVGDPTKRDDDRVEFDDSKTTEADRTPGCRLSGAGEKGTLTIWDSAPAYELVVEL